MLQIEVIRFELKPQAAIDLVANIFRQMAKNPAGMVMIEFPVDDDLDDTGLPPGAIEMTEPADADDD